MDSFLESEIGAFVRILSIVSFAILMAGQIALADTITCQIEGKKLTDTLKITGSTNSDLKVELIVDGMNYNFPINFSQISGGGFKYFNQKEGFSLKMSLPYIGGETGSIGSAGTLLFVNQSVGLLESNLSCGYQYP